MTLRRSVHVRLSAICLAMTALTYAQNTANAISASCVIVGDCLPCAKSEMSEQFCKMSGHKQELSCLEGGVNRTKFKECIAVSSAYSECHDVVMFEVIMLLLLLLAFQALRKEKQKYVSSFDKRKDPHTPSKPFQI
ncbi:hypothetical protein AC1031_000698 [Aphanomyces cochlioides]|nr:hypothetical protein AC1031_000698 [Aphanomyces cochlioides]